ncbi:MAG: 30S ribosomal protein S5 [Simkaniaceae bacterium]|nr:30S ribosomal protein S5 [Simkaniaceae bacterium]MCF7851878.1 30S ribosomal protein S5 [Simkaniaceae bacterium]
MAQDKKKQRQADVNKTDLEEKVLHINRCSKTVKGGKRFSFSALILVGNGEGKIGLGFAKANEVADAIKKASESARKNLISFQMEGTTIPHEVIMSWDGAKVFLKPASEGTGVIAGSKVRSVLELGGVKDVVAKSMGSSNPINLVRATIKALLSLKSRNEVLQQRGVV